METTTRVSKWGTLGWSDSLRGAGLSAITAVLTLILDSFQKGSLEFNWTAIGTTAGVTFIGYLVKNGIFEPSKVITTVPTESVDKVETAIKKVT